MPASQAKTIERIWPVRPPVEDLGGHRLLALHRLHAGGGAGEVALLAPVSSLSRKLATRKQTARTKMTEQVTPTRLAGRSLEPDRDDRARGGRSPQARVEQQVGGHAGHATEDHREDQLRLHEHVGEVDLVDAAEELDDRSAPGAEALAMPLPKKVKASSSPRPGPGLASMRNRIDLPFSAASVVPSGVKTPWLIALLRKRTLAGSTKIEVSGSRLWSTRKSTTSLGGLGEGLDERSGHEEAADGQDHAPDAGREVVDQHLEAGPDLAVPQGVELAHRPAAQRTHDHGAEEHRHVRTGDRTHGGDRADHAAADVVVAVGHPPAGVADQDRQQVGDHRADDAAAVGVPPAELGDEAVVVETLVEAGGVAEDLVADKRDPARLDEQGGDEAPGDEGADVGQDHVGQEGAELLHPDPGPGAGRWSCGGRGHLVFPLVTQGRDARHGRDAASLHTFGHVAKHSGRLSCPLMWSFL